MSFRRTDQQTALSIFFQEVSVANCGGGGHAHHLHYNQVRCFVVVVVVVGVYVVHLKIQQKKFSWPGHCPYTQKNHEPSSHLLLLFFNNNRKTCLGNPEFSLSAVVHDCHTWFFSRFFVACWNILHTILILTILFLSVYSSYVRQPIRQRHPRISLTPWPPLPNSQLQINTVPRQVCCRCEIYNNVS